MLIVAVCGSGAMSAVAVKGSVPLFKSLKSVIYMCSDCCASVIPHIFYSGVRCLFLFEERVNTLSYEGIVVYAYVAVEESHKAGNSCLVRDMIGRVTRGGKTRHTVVCPDSHTDNAAADEIVYESTALGGEFDRARREQDIVVDQSGPV